MSAERETLDPVADLVRSADFDAYAASLFAPAQARPHLLALHAFDIELGRVRDLVSEPMPGELRLQWWRDALENPERADVVSHPIARALEGAIRFGKLPRQALVDMIDARLDDLYDDPVPTIAALEGRLGATSSALLRLSSLVVAEGSDPGGAEVAGYGGVARGLVRALRLLPAHAARGQILLPVDRMAALGVDLDALTSGRGGAPLVALVGEMRSLAARRLDEARNAFGSVDEGAAVAFLPLATIRGGLKDLARSGDPLRPPPERSRWRRLLTLWRASRRRPPF